jgi:hypothetical protein
MGYFINPEFGYYEGDQINPSDIAVPQRPDYTHTWDGQAWQPSAATHNAPILAQIIGLEATITDRRWREAAPDDAGGSADGRAWLKTRSDQIAALRQQILRDTPAPSAPVSAPAFNPETVPAA